MANKGNVIWGLYILIAGVLLLLENLGVIADKMFPILWPIAIILV